MIGHVLIEGIVACFIVLIVCVVGIANGPVGLVCLYEKEVKQRVIARGLTTEARIKRSVGLFRLFGVLPLFLFVMIAVYGVNGARGFGEGFRQILVIIMMEGLFDRLFIDWYWVGKTKAWIIPGTEDLMPYIYGKTLIVKWATTLIGYPVLAAILAAVMNLILK